MDYMQKYIPKNTIDGMLLSNFIDIMKKITILLSTILLLSSLFTACKDENVDDKPDGAIDATDYGVCVGNSGEENSRNLQNLINSLTQNGGTIYIPSGEYTFCENGTQTIGSHCIKMQSNVNIVGEGESTVLKPTGASSYGLDMFYFNDYLDVNTANYLENCRFENFTIDASATSCEVYTSAGKGFMFNLFRNCHWDNVTVKNTDATGFGVDCPLESTIADCVAINCGKAANEQSGGASGFGIGFGYADGENIRIENCQALDNTKFGFFFEHQGRFNANKYAATASHNFTISNCNAAENLYNFGGICAMNTIYQNCYSQNSKLYGFYFENSTHSKAQACQSKNETQASFVISQSHSYNVHHVLYERCNSENCPYGVKVLGDGTAIMSDNRIHGCSFLSIGIYNVYTSGTMQSFTLTENTAEHNFNHLTAQIQRFENTKNSWN